MGNSKDVRRQVLGALAGLAGIGWLGLQLPPRSFPPPAGEPGDAGHMALPTESDLPAPAARHLRLVLGNTFPRMDTAHVWGRGRLKIAGLWVPLRFKAGYQPGQAIQRVMEMTWYGIPFVWSHERWDGQVGETIMAGAVKRQFGGGTAAQALNLSLWAEAAWMPAVFMTDSRLRWETIHAAAARLIVPFGAGEDQLVAHFDPHSGLMTDISGIRHRHECGDEGKEKRPWLVQYRDWQSAAGVLVPGRLRALWGDATGCYVDVQVEGVRYNLPDTQSLK